jgi:hypothetical protein
MNLQFFDTYPYRALEPDLQTLVLGARRVDAAVAFVTRPGVAFLHQYLKSRPSGKARLVASVRFPTNLPELANLEDDYPGTVFLHTGFQFPVEDDGDRGQFHSKIVLLEMAGTERCIVVGSHNWTGNALNGLNMEAGMILRCQDSDPIVAQVRQHIQACATAPGTEPFTRQRLKFYQTIQCDLHRRIGPGSTDSEDFPGFEPMEALVMHAEDATGTGIPDPFQIFVPVRDAVTREFFPTRRRVLLYVYPRNSLLGKSPPTAVPVAFEGIVTMANEARADDSAAGRPATCKIDSLDTPMIELLPGNAVPRLAGSLAEVVIRLEGRGQAELPIFHRAKQQPKMRLGVKYEPIDRDGGDHEAMLKRLRHREDDTAGSKALLPLPEYLAPRHLTLEADIKVPGRNLYQSEIEKVLRWFLFNCDLFDESMVPSLTISEPAPATMLSPFVYQVNHFLSKETMARVEKQLRLFRE